MPFLPLNGAEIPDNVLEPQAVCWGRIQKAAFHWTGAWRGLGEAKGLLIIMRSLGRRLPRPSQSHSLLRDRELNMKGLPKSLSPGGPCTLGPSPQNKPTGSGHIMVAM